LRTLRAFECALEERARDPGLDELPIGFGRGGERADFFFVQLQDGGFFKKMAVEMFDLVFAESSAGCHRRKKVFERFGEMFGIVRAGLENVLDHTRGKQAGVLSEETKDDAIEKAGDAQVLALSDGMFLARFRI